MSFRKCRLARRLCSRALAATILFFPPIMSTQAEEVTEHPITCAESPIQFAFEVKDSRDDHCQSWTYDGTADWATTRWEQFHRYEEFDRGFINVRYLRADSQTFLYWYELKKQIRMRFKRTGTEARAWQDTVKVRVKERAYDTRAFELPGDLFCTGFVTRWGHFDEGDRNILVGYVCGGNRNLSLQDVTEVVSAIELR